MTLTTVAQKLPGLNSGKSGTNMPVNPAVQGWTFYLAAFFSVLLCVTGCQSAKAPGSSSTAAVLISGSHPSAIRAATIKVFEENDYTTLRTDEMELVFEREGTTWDTTMYGTFGGGKLWMRVEVKIQPHGSSQLLRCDVFAVRNHGDAFFSETQKVRPMSAKQYKKLLAEVQSRVGTGFP